MEVEDEDSPHSNNHLVGSNKRTRKLLTPQQSKVLHELLAKVSISFTESSPPSLGGGGPCQRPFILSQFSGEYFKTPTSPFNKTAIDPTSSLLALMLSSNLLVSFKNE